MNDAFTAISRRQVAQSRPIRMRRLVGWGVIGQIGYVSSQFVLLIALARFQTVEIVGAFGLASAISFPVVWFFNLGLRTNVATDIKGQYCFADFLRLRIVTCLTAYAVLVGIALLALDGLGQSILLVFAAAKVVELFSELCYGVFQRADRMAFVARSQALRGLISAALFTLLLSLGFSAEIAFLGNLTVWAVIAVGVDLRAAYEIAAEESDDARATWPKVWSLILMSLPLGLNGALGAIQGNVPRYVLGWMVGLAALGQFTVVAYALQAISTVFNAISQSIVSRLAGYITQGKRGAFFGAMKKLMLILIGIGIILTGLSLLIGDQFIALAFGPEYEELGELLTLVVMAAMLQSTMNIFQAGVQAARRFHLVAAVRVVFLVVMALACLAGTWSGGLMGLVWAMMFVYAAQTVVMFVLLIRLPFNVVEDKV